MWLASLTRDMDKMHAVSGYIEATENRYQLLISLGKDAEVLSSIGEINRVPLKHRQNGHSRDRNRYQGDPVGCTVR